MEKSKPVIAFRLLRPTLPYIKVQNMIKPEVKQLGESCLHRFRYRCYANKDDQDHMKWLYGMLGSSGGDDSYYIQRLPVRDTKSLSFNKAAGKCNKVTLAHLADISMLLISG